MTICSEQVNLNGLDIYRPVRQGAGGDESSAPVPVALGLDAIYEAVSDSFKNAQGREIFITGRFWINPTDSSGDVIDVRADDHLQYRDFRGKLVKRQRIVRASPMFCGPELDHIMLEIG